MTEVLTDTRPIRLKGRSFLALVLSPELPFENWLARLDDLAARSAGFFLRRPIVLDVAALDIDRTQLRELVDQLAERNVRIMGIEGARPSMLDQGLPPAMADGKPASDFEPPAASQPKTDEDEAETESADIERSVAPIKAMPSMMVTQPVRSGQSVIFPEGDVTVVGSVASGAEIVAGGSIHVYGTLRGRAMAGSAGNPKARVFCNRLEAELLAIDGLYRTADDMDAACRGRAAQAWLEDDVMIIAALD